MDKRKELYESTAAVPALANMGSDFDTCGGSLTGIVQEKKSLRLVLLYLHLDEMFRFYHCFYFKPSKIII